MTGDSMDPLLDSAHDQWRPVTPTLTNAPGERSRHALRSVIDQFGLATSARYAPRDGLTFCNIFSWDFTRAMGCEVPHWWDADGKRRELTANETLRLMRGGAFHGWRECSAAAAVDLACIGQPVLAMWLNGAGGPGHVSAIEPHDVSDWRQAHVAQAGRVSGTGITMARAFGEHRLALLDFWTHD